MAGCVSRPVELGPGSVAAEHLEAEELKPVSMHLAGEEFGGDLPRTAAANIFDVTGS